MAIKTSMEDSLVITGEQAKYQSAAQKKANTIGKQTTDRGTLITKSNNEFDKNSFLKILVAQMQNLDPTQDQDSTAYVTQMAQFTEMEQLYNLNETMTGYAKQSLIGKGATVDVADSKGMPYTGIIKSVTKENGTWYVTMEVNEDGKNVYKVFDASRVKSTIEVPDNINSNMLINSDFMAASNLAKDENNKVVLLSTDSDGKDILVKGVVKSAFIDNGIVKIRVSEYDEDGELSEETKEYAYSSIYKAGNLTDEDMSVEIEDIIGSDEKEEKVDTSLDPNSPDYDKSEAYARLNNSRTEIIAGSSLNNSVNSSSTYESEEKKLEEILNL